ncbi:MAG: hypothetical protein HY537_15545 [Deltaproteobacteria bacterium]|nr:hypothetical protein [Deltaproteobacteria bacterium]
MRLVKCSLFFLFSFLAFADANTPASQNCIVLLSECLPAYQMLGLPGTAVEVEPRIKGKNGGSITAEAAAILALTEPPGGKVAGLLTTDKIPKPIATKLQTLTANGDIGDISWERVPTELQHELLVEATRQQRPSFDRDRTIKGLQVKSQIAVQFNEPTTIFGRHFEAEKKYLLDIEPLLADRSIQYGGPDYVDDVSLFEFHFRIESSRSGAFLQDLYQLLDGAGVHKDQVHVHVLAKIDRNALARESRRESLRQAEHWRRTNLGAEMISIVDKGLSLRPVKAPSGAVEWDSLESRELGDMAVATERYLRAGITPIGEPFKMAYVSFHFPGKYDDKSALGYQFRSVSRPQESRFRVLLDRAQDELHKRQLGLSDQALDQWIHRFPAPTSVDSMAGTLWYRGPNNLRLASPEAVRILAETRDGATRLSNLEKQSLEVGMLTYDWSKDPFVQQFPSVASSVGATQAKYLRQLLQNGGSAQYYVSKFLSESNLYDLFVLDKHPGK